MGPSYLKRTSDVKVVAGTAYTLTRADNCRYLRFNNASDVTVTVPALFVEMEVSGIQAGAGQVTFVEDETTINSKGGAKKTSGQYSPFYLKYTDADDVIDLGGDITA